MPDGRRSQAGGARATAEATTRRDLPAPSAPGTGPGAWLTGPPARRLAVHAGFAAATVLATWAGRWTRPDDSSYALVWPAAAVSVLWLAAAWRSPRAASGVALALAAVTGTTLGLTGAPPVLGGVYVLAGVAMAVAACATHRLLQPEGWFLSRPRDLTTLALSALVAGVVGACIGPPATWLAAGGGPLADLVAAMGAWALRVGLSIIVVGAVVLTVAEGARARRFHRSGPVETVLLLLAVAAVSVSPGRVPDMALPLLLAPLGVWVGLRFCRVLAAGVVAASAVGLVAVTIAGPLLVAGVDPTQRAVLIQVLIAETAIVTLSLAVYRSEREDLIGQLRTARAAAEQERGLLATVLDAMGDGVVIVDRRGEVAFSNPAAQRLLPPAPDAPDDRFRCLPLDRALAGERVVGTDVPVTGTGRSGGGAGDPQRVLSVTAVPLAGWDGLVGAVAVCNDVTARRSEAASMLRALRAEREAAERLSEVDRVKNELLTTVGHELRTPLTSISGYAEMLGDGVAGPLTAEQAGFVEVVSRNAARLRRLVEDLLTLSDVQAGTFRLRFDALDLRDVVRAGCDDVIPSHVEPAPLVTVSLPDEPVPVRGDAAQLQRAVGNLVSNALTFTGDGGEVSVGVRSRSGEAVVVVADTGTGMSPGTQWHVLRSFHRGSEASSRAVPGAGLGLSVTKAIVDSHDGSVAVDSATGLGTRVTVVLPIVEHGASDGGISDAHVANGGGPAGLASSVAGVRP